MGEIELSIEVDAAIDVANLSDEFRRFPILMYRYCELKAEAEESYEVEKAVLEEKKADLYKALKSGDSKYTENHIKAEIEDDAKVKKQKRKMLEAKKDYETIKGYVEALKAKKDCLIQLGADARAEGK